MREDLSLALATVALVPAIYASALPPLAVVRGHVDVGGHLLVGVGQAAAFAGLLVAAVVAVTGSAAVAVIGGGAVIAYACLFMHARETAP